MKRVVLYLLMCVSFSLVWITPTAARPSPEESKLERTAATLNQDANQPKGKQLVTQRLEHAFTVSEAQINSLREQHLGFGEIAIVLGLAQKMSGGITDTNIKTVLTMRQGPPVMGWGEIAKKLHEKLGPIVSQTEKVAAASHKQLGETRAQTPMRPESMAPPGKPNRQ